MADITSAISDSRTLADSSTPTAGMSAAATGVAEAPVPLSYNFTYEQAVSRNMQQDIKSAAEQAAIDAALAAGPASTSTSIFGTPPMPTSTLTPTGTDGAVTGSDLEKTLVDQAGGALPAGTEVKPTLLADANLSGTTVTGSQLTTPAPTVSADQAAPVADVVSPTAPTDMSKYTYEADTTADKVTDATAAQLTADEVNKNVYIDPNAVQGTLSEGALADTVTGEVTKESLTSYQLGELYSSIEEGKPLPAWASGPVRAATQIMSKRGLGKSSMAAAAVSQAVLEGALPIANADAQEYSKINVLNISNEQATTLQNAATIAQMDLANLDARMKAAVQNAQSFLAIDLKNLDNEQASNVLTYQSKIQAMFNDTAAKNAAKQFNAESQAQVDQFYDELAVQTANSNANRTAAMAQFNVDQVNSIRTFNASLTDARERFNAEMSLQVEQSNAQWRRDIATADTAAVNEAQRQNAMNTLNISQNALNALWQKERDEAAWLYQSAENATDRAFRMAMYEMQVDAEKEMFDLKATYETGASLGGLALDIIFGKRTTGTGG